MKRKAVIVSKGSKYNICCDIDFLSQFIEYVMKDPSHGKEMKLIFAQVREGLRSKKYGDEPYGTKAMKPFKNRDNDRIICNVTKRKGMKQCIVMAEIFLSKKTEGVDNKLYERYKKYQNTVMKSLKELRNFLEDETFDLEHEAAMVQSRILSPIIAAIEDNKIKQEELAEATGLTQPFISALLNIRKKLNMEHIALFQEALGIILQVPEALIAEEHKSKFYSEKEYEIESEQESLMGRFCSHNLNMIFTDYKQEVTNEKYKWATKNSLTRIRRKRTNQNIKTQNSYLTSYIQ